MLNIATPELSPAEWHDVKAALIAVADCGCGDPAPVGPLRARLSHALNAIIGAPRAARTPPADLLPLRDFLCETGRTRQIAERHMPALYERGFSRRQIDALALLGA
ncbi:hypothetical protein [Sphingobium sp. CFD-2]|uniref:hypothetical protein n=1 Tax=Sphingobium sp. CFD-2 TaxID=2878542 RepID=UPI00214CE406|nr:hypothetical protein [Sphingobium sp. CFD-2]